MSIAIIGGGIVGLTAGAYLKQHGIEDFIIIEEESEVGGTWRDHDYPGAGTDTEAPSYIPTFLPIPDFKSQFATRHEIFTYIKDVIAKQYVGYDKIRLGRHVLKMSFSNDDLWHITAETSAGTEVFQARFIIPAYYSLNKKHIKVPQFPGRERFSGAVLHSSQLTSDLSQYTEKDVVVVGCGATAVQLVPSISGVVRTVTVLRRTMPYISLKKKTPAPKTQLGWTLHRWQYELRNDIITSFDWARHAEWLLRNWVWFKQYRLPVWTGSSAPLPKDAYPHPEQPVQCTRRAFDYLGFRECLSKPHVNIIDISRDPIKSYTEEGIALESGQVCRADLVILATGYNLGSTADNTPPLVVDDKHVLDIRRSPNIFLPYLGCPLFCIPTRVCEDSMGYFVREYRRHMNTVGRISFLPIVPPDPDADAKTRRNHVVFSPHCSSGRYFNTRPGAEDSREPLMLQDAAAGGIPRFIFQRFLHRLSARVLTNKEVITSALRGTGREEPDSMLRSKL